MRNLFLMFITEMYFPSKEKTPKLLAPIEMEILFCASEASAKKIVMESGTNLQRSKNLIASKKKSN